MSCLQELLSADVGEQEQQRIEDDVQSYLQLVQKVRITTSSFCNLSPSLSLSSSCMRSHLHLLFSAADFVFCVHVCIVIRLLTGSVLSCLWSILSFRCMCVCV